MSRTTVRYVIDMVTSGLTRAPGHARYPIKRKENRGNDLFTFFLEGCCTVQIDCLAMGIPRLTSFVDNTFTGWQREEITGNLVIDGYSLIYSLYSFDWSHGGQFPEYHSKVAHFFMSLGQSGITPLVVMDGIDYREEKTSTTIKRRNDAIKTIHKHTANTQKRNIEAVDDILPPLAVTVFLMVMTELRVKFTVVDGEGDMWIYQLANAYSCPVLSSDSDFLMFKLKGGYIPYNRFHWEASPVNAEVFYYRAFCEQLKFRDESLRLVISAIAGNDFLQGVNTPSFMSHIGRIIALETKGHRLVNVVKYICLFKSLEDFIDNTETIACLDDDEKRRLQENCLKSQEMYDCEDETSFEKISRETALLAFNSEALPDWVLKQFREGKFSRTIMEALVVGKATLQVFVDNTVLGSCLHASLPIRQHMYGLTRSSLVTEFYREGLELCGRGIHSIDSINGRPLPSLDRIPSLSVVNREQLLYSILGCDSHLFQNLPNHWKLVMATTLYWAQHTKPPPHTIKALILSFVVCSTSQYELPKMRTEFFIPDNFRHSPKWMLPLHAFAQWQGTYMNAMALNHLLMLPLEALSPALLYDGKLAMFFSLPENDDHLASMLPIDHQVYADLVAVVLPHQSATPVSPVAKFPPLHKKSNQPPRFQNAPIRGGQSHLGGRRIGQNTGEFRGRGRGRGRGKNPPNDSWGPRKGDIDSRPRERSISGVSQETSDTTYTITRGGRHSRSAARGAAVSPTKVIVTKPPKFTHTNRYAALLGGEGDSEDESEPSD